MYKVKEDCGTFHGKAFPRLHRSSTYLFRTKRKRTYDPGRPHTYVFMVCCLTDPLIRVVPLLSPRSYGRRDTLLVLSLCPLCMRGERELRFPTFDRRRENIPTRTDGTLPTRVGGDRCPGVRDSGENFSSRDEVRK